MHPNPAFRGTPASRNLTFARDRAFGVLAAVCNSVPTFAHVPFLLSETGTWADLHLVRSNPIARALKAPLACTIIVSGPDSYVSPDWYEVEDQVPTWNYVAVHLTGSLELRPRTELRDLLDRQSAFFEERLHPKPPWTADKMTPDALDRMMRQIVPCRVHIDSVDATWKLNQNKPEDVRLRAADRVEAAQAGQETGLLAANMRDADRLNGD